MCTVLLPPGGYPFAVNKYIISLYFIRGAAPKYGKCASFSLYLSIMTHALHDDRLSFCRIEYLTARRRALFEECKESFV